VEAFSGMKKALRIPLNIEIPAYLRDHRFMGRAVFPAVEAMRLLADSVRSEFPEIPGDCICNARFDKFLPLSPEQEQMAVFHEAKECEDRVISKLITRIYSEKTGIGRSIAHVMLHFPKTARPRRENLPAAVPEKNGPYKIPAERVYAELVPFGPYYQNIIGSVQLSENRASADVRGGSAGISAYFPNSSADISVSPFPLDAAFHTACVWSQRYAGMVAFPVAFKARHIIRPVLFNKTYRAVSFPLRREKSILFFDIVLYDRKGNLCESVEEMQMRDVSRGRLSPPPWIKKR
jgi:hypothetical protein